MVMVEVVVALLMIINGEIKVPNFLLDKNYLIYVNYKRTSLSFCNIFSALSEIWARDIECLLRGIIIFFNLVVNPDFR